LLDIKKYTCEFKTFFKLSIPVMLGQLGHVLVGFADNIMVGKLGANALAAVSLANSIFYILMGLGIGFSMAITPLIAEADGIKNYSEVKKNYQHGVVMMSVFGVLTTLSLMFLKPLLSYLNQPPEVLELAIPYYEVLAFSMIPLFIFQAIKQFTDGLSYTKFAMYAILSSNVLNILINYLFIYGKFGLPKLGVTGAALGSLVSRIVMIFTILYFIQTQKAFKPYKKIAVSWFTLEKNRIVKLLKLGYPTALQMFFEIGIFASGVILAGTLGAKSQAANQIALNLSTMTFMVATGMGVATTIRVSNQKGLGNFKNLKRIALSGMFLMVVLSSFFGLLFFITKNYLPLIYIDDIAVIKIASKLLIVSALFQVSDGLQVVVLGTLRGLQDMLIPMLLIFISYWLIGFPVSFFAGIYYKLGVMGIWYGLLVGLTVSSILLYLRFRKLIRLQINNS